MASSEKNGAVPEVSINGSTAKGLQPDLRRQLSAQSQQSTFSRSQTFLRTLLSWRAAMTLHMHISLILLVMMSLNMPLALVCMLKTPLSNDSFTGPEVMSHQNATSVPSNFSVNGSEVMPQNSTSLFEELESLERNGSVYSSGGEFQWDSSIQGLLLSSNTMLAFIMPLMVDLLIRKLGGKRMILGTMLLSACLTLLQPQGARLSPYVLVALRLAVGFLAGMKFPLLNEVFAWWAPNSEKVTMVSFAFSGVNTASVLVSLTSGFLCSISLDNGWPFIFYMHGTLTIIWCIFWQLTGSIKPEDHPFISEDEKQYIIRTRLAMDRNQKRTSPPYRKILSSVPVWGCLIMFTTHTYSFLILLSYLPMYLNGSLGFSVQQVGLISAVTYVVRFLGVLGWGQMSNLLLRKTRLHTTTCRKLVQCTGFYLSGVGLVVLSVVRGQVVSTVLLTVVLLCQSCTSACVAVVPLDMAPRYAGFVSGFINCVCTIITIPGPLLTASMVQNGTVEEWRTVFLSLAAVVFVGTTCFLFMGSSQLQSWATPEKKDNSQMPSSDVKARKMSVLSEGLPSSPTREQRRFNFSRTITTPNFNDARLGSTDSALPKSSPSAPEDVALSVISTSTIYQVTPASLSHRGSQGQGSSEDLSTAGREGAETDAEGKSSGGGTQERLGSAKEPGYRQRGRGTAGGLSNLGYDDLSDST